MSEEVIELSVEETNKLRASLGLAPLRVGNQSSSSSSQPIEPSASVGNNNAGNGDQEVLEMSVDETNALRARLGLAPLRTGDGKASAKKEVIHKPAQNTREEDATKQRIEQAKLKREAKQGAEQTFGSSTLSDNQKQSALSWADQMRKQPSKKTAKKSVATSSNKAQTTSYQEHELEGMHVSHNANEFETGSTTVLTLADAPLLQTQHDGKAVGLNEDGVALENVSLMQSKKQEDGLRKKRLLEMGMGRAGGYAGFDDDEFEELGGTIGPSRQARSAFGGDDMDESGPSAVMGGFQIGRAGVSGEENISDFDKIQRGKAVSLVPTKADVAASDYMTLEEEEEEARARRKKDAKFKKKKKKDKKKRRKTQVDSDDEEPPVGRVNGTSTNILEQLEATATDDADDSAHRKRRRVDSDEDAMHLDENPRTMTPSSQPSLKDKQSRYDKVMAKGNKQTEAAFAEPTRPKETPKVEDEQDDMDDSFLNAALAKARRLNRLKAMNQSKGPKGADAVVAALQTKTNKREGGSTKSGVVSCAIDDTREFTLALAARAQQKEREAEKARQQKQSTSNNIVAKERDSKPEVETVPEDNAAEGEGESMEELAKQVKTDDLNSGLDGGTARSVGVGRGLSSFMSMLKTTGEVSGKNGKEELKGRAKDERNYENYQPLDLSKVVKIGSKATDKDKEMASREVKLEYRDKHGRLLTTKEAYREMCYQFHGHGASKKKEEKRLRQMEREQAQTRMASRQVASAQDGTTAGTLGALQATQKATGKAFLVHKT
eukprot:Nitzschia sp. Nitz4//scaffold88_size82704//30801//33128//NITZ4_005289-RA/size82704-processed-gene-0.50-mRNA-1//1//CDS//3329559485//4776//frame0